MDVFNGFGNGNGNNFSTWRAEYFICFSFIIISGKGKIRVKIFSPLQFKTLNALAEVIIYGEKKFIPSEDVAKNVDKYFSSFEAKTKWTMALVITGLSSIRYYPGCAPRFLILKQTRDIFFLKNKFYRDVELGLIPGWWKVYIQGMIRIAKQMCYIGYYNDSRTFASVGYVPFSQRKDRNERLSKSPVTEVPSPLYVKSQDDVKGESVDGRCCNNWFRRRRICSCKGLGRKWKKGCND